jgi:hypothetical protein
LSKAGKLENFGKLERAGKLEKARGVYYIPKLEPRRFPKISNLIKFCKLQKSELKFDFS